MAPEFGLTGAHGVLGQRITEAAQAAGAVVNAFRGDVRDASEVESWLAGSDFHSVIHCAAIVPVDRVAADPGEAIAVNVGGAANVARAASAAGVHLVFISTAHVYAPKNGHLAEHDPLGPTTLYGLTKLQAEHWCERLSDRVLTARVFSYFDPRQQESYFLPGLVRRLIDAPSRAEVVLRGSSDYRDFASARWLGHVIVRLAALRAQGVVNVGTGTATAVSDVAQRVAKLLGRTDVVLVPQDDGQHTTLVADRRRLDGLLPGLPLFDLDAELERFIRER